MQVGPTPGTMAVVVPAWLQLSLRVLLALVLTTRRRSLGCSSCPLTVRCRRGHLAGRRQRLLPGMALISHPFRWTGDESGVPAKKGISAAWPKVAVAYRLGL